MRLCLHGFFPIILLLALAPGCAKREEGRARRPDRTAGEALFAERCRDCHKIDKKGGEIGPDLTGIAKKRTLRFVEQVIRDPSGTFPGTVMPLYNTLSARQVNALVHYVGTSEAAEPAQPKNSLNWMKRIRNERQR